MKIPGYVSKREHEAVVVAKDAEIARLKDEVGTLEDQLADARYEPWPQWADDMKSQIRAASGYDGYDDALDGVNLPEELSELINALSEEACKNVAEARASRKLDEAERAAEHYRLQSIDLRARLAVFTAPRTRDERGRFKSGREQVA